MREKVHLIYFIALAIILGCASCGDKKDAANSAMNSDFDQTMHVADSLYNSMQFRDAYDMYLRLLDNTEAKADSEKMLNVLNSLCMASELAGHKTEQTKWLKQLMDLAKQTGNTYYEAMGLEAMGKRLYYEGDKQQGIKYVSDAVDMMAKTDTDLTDHYTHSLMIILEGLYVEMNDYENALKTDERNVRLTREGTRWGQRPDQQQRDHHMALAKMAYSLAKLGHFSRADSAYAAWKAIEYEGSHARDYFISDYLRARGRYQEAAQISNDLIEKVRAYGDTLGEMMSSAKWVLADIYKKMGRYQQAASLYDDVLVIQDTLKQRQARSTAQELAAIYRAQEQQLALEQEQAANTRHRLILIIVLAVLLGVAAYTVNVIRQKRIISRKNQSLAEEITEAMKYKELYHAEKFEKLPPQPLCPMSTPLPTSSCSCISTM